MSVDPSRSLSDKVEETIEGAVRFVVRFLRTTCVILFRPLTCERLLLAPERGNRRFVRPMSYLAIGGFVFALTLSVYPKGLLGMVNLIWFNEEVNRALLARWQEAISVSGLLLAAFPVLICTAVVTGLVSRLIPDLRRRQEFVALNAYLFGFQCLLLLSGFVIALTLDVGKALFGVEVREILRLEAVPLPETVANLLLLGPLAITLSALVMPTVGLWCWTGRALRKRRLATRLCAWLAIVPYCFAMLALCAYSASVPAAFKEVATPKAGPSRIHFLSDPVIRVVSVDADRTVLAFDYQIAIENVASSVMIVPRDAIRAGIVRESRAAGTEERKDEFWTAANPRLSQSGGEVPAIVIAKSGLASYGLAGTVELDPAEWLDLARKADSSVDTNHYGFFYSIDLRQGADETTRRLWLDVSALMAKR